MAYGPLPKSGGVRTNQPKRGSQRENDMPDPSPAQDMIRQFMEIVPARAILVAAKLGVADFIDSDAGLTRPVAAPGVVMDQV